MPPEVELAYSYTLADGREVSAHSRTEAIAQCPFLKNLPIEQADVMLELLAMPSPVEAVKEPKVQLYQKPLPTEKPAKQEQAANTNINRSSIAKITEEFQDIQLILSSTQRQIDSLQVDPELDAPEVHKLNVFTERQAQLELQADELADDLTPVLPDETSPNIAQSLPTENYQPLILDSHVLETPISSVGINDIQVNELSRTVAETTTDVLTKPKVVRDLQTETYERTNPSEIKLVAVEPFQTACETISYPETVREIVAEVEDKTVEEPLVALTIELSELFESNPPTNSESKIEPYVVETTTISLNESVAEAQKFPLLEEILDKPTILAEPSLEIEPLLPEIRQVSQSIREIIAAQEKPELTEQLVEQVVELLTLLGQPEPEKVLKYYAETHTIEEFIELLEALLPDITKLIDYQQHLLQALNNALSRSNRRQTVAELLNKLLFVPGWQLANHSV